MSDKILNRVVEERFNIQHSLMKIVVYNNANDIIVEFQDGYKTRVHTKYCRFISGKANNTYYPTVLNVGITGALCPIKDDNR